MSARVLFGFFFGICSINVPALAIEAGADLRGASIGGRADVASGGASARVGVGVDWVGEAEAGGLVGESDISSWSIGGGETLNPGARRQARVRASKGSAELRPAAEGEAVRVAKNEGSGASSSNGKGGTASGSQGKSGSQGNGKSGAESNSGKGGTASGSQGKSGYQGNGNSGTKGVLGGASVTPNRTAQNRGRPRTVSLPLILQPSRGRGGEATPRTPGGLLRLEQQFALRPGTPQVIVRACREAIVAGAVPHGAVRVSAASAGRLGRSGNALVAPISVSIEYRRRGGIERRQGRVNCLLTQEGSVVALR